MIENKLQLDKSVDIKYLTINYVHITTKKPGYASPT